MSERAWKLLEWTWKAAVGALLAVLLMLWTANHPSEDDVVRGVLAAIPAFLVGKTINPKE